MTVKIFLKEKRSNTSLDQRSAVERQGSGIVCLIQYSLRKRPIKQNTGYSSEEGEKYKRKQVTFNTS